MDPEELNIDVSIDMKPVRRGLNDIAGGIVFGAVFLGACWLKVSGVPVDAGDQSWIFIVLLIAFIKWL